MSPVFQEALGTKVTVPTTTWNASPSGHLPLVSSRMVLTLVGAQSSSSQPLSWVIRRAMQMAYPTLWCLDSWTASYPKSLCHLNQTLSTTYLELNLLSPPPSLIQFFPSICHVHLFFCHMCSPTWQDSCHPPHHHLFYTFYLLNISGICSILSIPTGTTLIRVTNRAHWATIRAC